MRTAITASVVATYLVVVGMGIFFVEEQGQLPAIAITLITSITSIVGIIGIY